MKQKVLDVIKRRRGWQNAISVNSLILETGNTLTDKELRDIITELIMEDREPIGSVVEGYFIITNSADLAKAKEHLLSPIGATVKRANTIEFNYQISLRIQGELPL